MKKYFITGLLIWIPLVITAWVLEVIVSTLDKTLILLPVSLQPERLFGLKFPGMGVVLTLAIIVLTGLFTANFMGQRLVRLWERLLSRIPVVKTVYHSVKQVSDSLFSNTGNAFRKALLIEYPRKGIWTIAFLTGQPGSALPSLPGDVDMISVYVPTTPNPTSGFFLLVPRTDAIELEMGVDDALKYIISMGVVSPPQPVSKTEFPS